MAADLGEGDEALRGLLTRLIAQQGFAPGPAELAEQAGCSVEETEASLRRLHEAHLLLLHPRNCEPWAVHPFALSPGSCWVETPRLGYWANCLYCAFGIAAALRTDARITTRLGGEAQTAVYEIEGGALVQRNGVFHLSTPAAKWWDNVIHACASFQPFASEADIDPWCARHKMARGAVMSLQALWSFAGDWYGSYLADPWRRRTPEQVRRLLDRHGLKGAFWSF
ncbi:MAG TPA: organomercurial lyase [Allosphingosinicella sp.]